MSHKDMSYDDAQRLAEIAEELMQLVDEARTILRGTDDEGYAESYILSHIELAVAEGGGQYVTRQTTLTDLANRLIADSGEGDDEEEWYRRDDETQAEYDERIRDLQS